jgi:hypothetical protein
VKTTTIVMLGLGAAAVLYFAMRPASSGSTGSHPGKSTRPASSRDALERAAVDLGAKVGGQIVDHLGGLFGSSSSSSSSYDGEGF